MSGVKRYEADVFTPDGRFRDTVVLASDYDRDTQAMRDELNACKSPPGGCGYWRESARLREAERDALRAQVEVMRELLRKVAPNFAAPPGFGYLHADVDAALQAKP